MSNSPQSWPEVHQKAAQRLIASLWLPSHTLAVIFADVGGRKSENINRFPILRKIRYSEKEFNAFLTEYINNISRPNADVQSIIDNCKSSPYSDFVQSARSKSEAIDIVANFFQLGLNAWSTAGSDNLLIVQMWAD